MAVAGNDTNSQCGGGGEEKTRASEIIRRFYNVLNYHKICYTFQVKTFKQNETNRNGTIYSKTETAEKKNTRREV